MNDLKVFVVDFGWAGNIVVIEKDEASARELMKTQYNYSPDTEMEIYEIKQGLIISNYGDL